MIIEFETKDVCIKYLMRHFNFVGKKQFRFKGGVSYYTFNQKEYTSDELFTHLVEKRVIMIVMKQDLVDAGYLKPRTRISRYQVDVDLLSKPASGNGLLLTATQAAKLLNLSRQTIYRLLDEETLETIKIFKTQYILRESIMNFIASRRGNKN